MREIKLLPISLSNYWSFPVAPTILPRNLPLYDLLFISDTHNPRSFKGNKEGKDRKPIKINYSMFLFCKQEPRRVLEKPLMGTWSRQIKSRYIS